MPLLSTRVFPLLARWLLMSPGAGAAAESGGSESRCRSPLTSAVLDLASALRAAARAVEEALKKGEEPSTIDESFAGVEGGAALLEAVKKREEEEEEEK